MTPFFHTIRYTLVPLPIKIPEFRGKRNIPRDYRGMRYIPGGDEGIPSPAKWQDCGAVVTFRLRVACLNYSLSNPRHYRGFIGFAPRFRNDIKNPPHWGDFLYPGGDEGITLALHACGETVTVRLRFTCLTYLFSNPWVLMAPCPP